MRRSTLAKLFKAQEDDGQNEDGDQHGRGEGEEVKELMFHKPGWPLSQERARLHLRAPRAPRRRAAAAPASAAPHRRLPLVASASGFHRAQDSAPRRGCLGLRAVSLGARVAPRARLSSSAGAARRRACGAGAETVGREISALYDGGLRVFELRWRSAASPAARSSYASVARRMRRRGSTLSAALGALCANSRSA